MGLCELNVTIRALVLLITCINLEVVWDSLPSYRNRLVSTNAKTVCVLILRDSQCRKFNQRTQIG